MAPRVWRQAPWTRLPRCSRICQDLDDPRTGNAKRHSLHEIVVIGLCTVLCGGESCADFALFGRSKRAFSEEFLTLEHGIPSHDTFSRVFRLLDPERFHAWFLGFMKHFAETCQGGVAIGGKTLRRSTAVGKVVASRQIGDQTTSETRYYLLSSAFAPERFKEDQARNRKDHGPQNLALLRNLAKLEPSKGSMRGKLKRAG